jgi:hypothetical protein
MVAHHVAELRQLSDPWKAQPDFEMPPIHLVLIKIRKPSGSIIDAWEEAKAA